MSEDSNEEKVQDMSHEQVQERIDEMNAMALAENLAELREHYEMRLTALENDVATLRNLIQAQTQVIGQTLQSVMGRGSTVKE